MSGASHGIIPICIESEIEGARRDQKLAAVITPAAKPKEPSKYLRLTLLVKKTADAPRAVRAQVKSVATRACMTGCKPSRYWSMEFVSSPSGKSNFVSSKFKHLHAHLA
jgi:hypothetical protein